MLSGRELALGVVGAWRLVRGDRAALLCFDRTPQGFWRSFWMMLLVAPAQALLAALSLAEVGIDPVPLRIAGLQLALYVVDWLLLPAVLSELALRSGRIPQFLAFGTAYNYAQLLLAAWWLAISAASAIAPGVGSLLHFAALGLSIGYVARIAYVTFDSDRRAAALTVLTLFLSWLVQVNLLLAAIGPLIPKA